MTLGIRDSEPGDRAAIRAILCDAFPTPVEAALVDRLTADGDSEISLVAADDDRIVGHVLLSRMTVKADGKPLRALGLAPVSVMPDRQCEGIGSRLIEAAIERASKAGWQIVFVVGEPGYYGRFGFSAEAAHPFASPYAGPYLQALVLDGSPVPKSGTAAYAAAFSGLE